MGSQNVRAISTTEDRKQFTHHLLNDVKALELMLKNDLFEKGIVRVGAEQELCIVKKDFTPANNSIEILEELNHPNFTTELATFNLEINLDPELLDDNCFSNIEAQLNAYLDEVRKVAKNQEGTKLILCGILPTLRLKDLTLDLSLIHI